MELPLEDGRRETSSLLKARAACSEEGSKAHRQHSSNDGWLLNR